MSNLLNNVIMSVNANLNAAQAVEVENRIMNAIKSDTANGKQGKSKTTQSGVRLSVIKTDKEQEASWSERTNTAFKSSVTPALTLDAAMRHWVDGVKRGYYNGGELPPLTTAVVNWIKSICERVVNPPTE